MPGDHRNAVTGLECLANRKGDDGAAISCDKVFAAGLEFSYPAISAGKLHAEKGSVIGYNGMLEHEN